MKFRGRTIFEKPRFSRNTSTLIVLLSILTCLYLIVFSGRIESGDSLILFDATNSLFRFGDWLLDESAIQIDEQHSGQGLASFQGERLQPILAQLLFWLAWIIPDLGLVHTTWTFNIFVTIGIIAIFYILCRYLKYSLNVSVIASLLLGTATILFPYTKTFFREPLVALILMGIVLSLEKARTAKIEARLIWYLFCIVLFFLVLETKQSSLLALPGLLCLVLFDRSWERKLAKKNHIFTKFLDALLLMLILFMLISCVIDLSFILYRLENLFSNYLSLPSLDLEYFQEAMASQIISPGGSIWGSSPVILLAFPGVLLLWKRGSKRHCWAAVVLLACYSIGHAARGPHWFGGLSWPPRFLLPVVPFLMILSLPVLESLEKKVHKLLNIVTAILISYSVFWQISSVIARWEDLPLPEKANGLLEWGGSLFSPRYFRPVLVFSNLDQLEFDFAWFRANEYLLPLILLITIMISFFLLRKLFIYPSHFLNNTIFILPVITTVLFIALLFAIAKDTAYATNQEAIHRMLSSIDEILQKNDTVFVTQEYRDVILNHSKVEFPRYVVLTFQPGERYHPEIPAEVASSSPVNNLYRYTAYRLNLMLSDMDRFYFLSDAGPFLPWRPRVIENFFAVNAYPIHEVIFAPDVRLIKYKQADLPDRFQEIELVSSVRFKNELRLEGMIFPEGLTFKPGDVIPLASMWSVETPVSDDFTFSWKLARNGQVISSSMDWQPNAGLNPTSTWKEKSPIWDLRGISLSNEIPEGIYELWLIVYYFHEGNLINLDILEGNHIESHISILPFKIKVLRDVQ